MQLLSAHRKFSCHYRSGKQRGLAGFQLFLCQKLHFWRACAARGALTLLSCQKMRGKKLTSYFTAWAGATGGIPAGLTVTQAESRRRKGLSFWDALHLGHLGQLQALCIQSLGPVPATVIYPGTCLPGYQHTAATCWHVHQTWKHLCFIFAAAGAGSLPRQSRANLIRVIAKRYVSPVSRYSSQVLSGRTKNTWNYNPHLVHKWQFLFWMSPCTTHTSSLSKIFHSSNRLCADKRLDC